MKKNYSILVSILLLASAAAKAQPSQPPAPPSFTCTNPAACTASPSEICSGNSTVVSNFQNATLRSGSANTVGAVYSFFNVATVTGQQINATITIDATSNVSMSGSDFNIDDDGATDQAGNSITSFFAPRVTPDQNLTTSDRRGYVQFTIRFFLNNPALPNNSYPSDFSSAQALSGLNYIHYDIDGSTVGTGGWFRETGLIGNVAGSSINANVPTELSAYTYTDGINWKGFAGSTCERTGVSRCAEVAAAANYTTAQNSVMIRMGYDYNYTGTSFNSQPTRQFGSRFGCFTFPQQGTLPVKLSGFNGVYHNQHTLLNWATESETNFDHFEIERSTDGTSYSSVAIEVAKNSVSKANYQVNDDLSSAIATVFYYRLKMVDKDGKFAYSQVVMIKKDSKTISGISINPNPVSGGVATVRMTAASHGSVEIRIMDISGRVMIKQIQNVYEGNNAITLNVQQLLPGIYTMQMADGNGAVAAKFSIVR